MKTHQRQTTLKRKHPTMPKHRRTISCKVSLAARNGGCEGYIDRLPLGSRHAGAADRIADALSALEGRNAHHIGVSFGGLVLVLEADVLVAVVPGSDAAQQSRLSISKGV